MQIKLPLHYSRRRVQDVYYMEQRKVVKLCKNCTYFQNGFCMYLTKPMSAVEMRTFHDLCGPLGRFYQPL